MSIPSGVEVPTECITAFKELLYKKGGNKLTFVIYKISDDNRSIIVEEKSSEKSYEEFRQKLTSSVDHGQRAPRYAVYDVEYDLKDDGRRATTVFISWVPEGTSTKFRMLYAATKEQLRRALDVQVSIHADDPSDIEWRTVLREASEGRVQV